MKDFFSYNNPLIRLLARACDMMIVNVLFLITSIPIITIGASLCGLNKVSQAIAMGDERGILKLYFSGFKSNFKQATVIWMVTLAVIVGLASLWFLITNFCTGVLAVILYVVFGIAALGALSLVVYIFPLVVRYENTLKEHRRNALVLSITRPLLTIILDVLNAVLFLLPVISLQAFMQTLIFWIIIGFGFLSYMVSITIKPVFDQLESASK